ncbi:MAG: hypothetical protein WB440_01935, partial [Steroidobacteraceae bacterium]
MTALPIPRLASSSTPLPPAGGTPVSAAQSPADATAPGAATGPATPFASALQDANTQVAPKAPKTAKPGTPLPAAGNSPPPAAGAPPT